MVKCVEKIASRVFGEDSLFLGIEKAKYTNNINTVETMRGLSVIMFAKEGVVSDLGESNFQYARDGEEE